MDQKRLLLFIAISAAILIVFQFIAPRPVHHAAAPPAPPAASQPASPVAANPYDAAPGMAGLGTETTAIPAEAPRVKISATRVLGSISLLGARLDDIQLRDYHDTVDRNSPLVRVLQPSSTAQPAYVQFGWSGAAGMKTPATDTLWSSSGGDVAVGHPVTLAWDNGQGIGFGIELSVDDNYMFAIRQTVRNTGTASIQLWPWQRIRRDYTPPKAVYGVLFEGMLGVADGLLHNMGYPKAGTEAAKNSGVAYTHDGAGGWAGFTDKYWLTALIPDQAAGVKAEWQHWQDNGADRFQVSYLATTPVSVAPGASAGSTSRVFIGAKEVHLLDRYETVQHIPLLSYAVDWGHFFFLTKPFFYALDWLNSVLGNFGLAILVFTVGVKAVFFPLASYSYRSMGKMRLLGPKIQAMKERNKDDPARQQKEMMEIYKAEKVNPASGCLPMIIQIPVFFSLYKDILVTIEMRHAPFFGWIQDLSATDPTNIFNLFGLLPFDPTTISHSLHLGIWPLVMGATMFFQQRLNPPPPDPTQAKMLQFMPLLFMFMMGSFPAGLVIYWSWNNTLTIAQQWYIQRNAHLTKTRIART